MPLTLTPRSDIRTWGGLLLGELLANGRNALSANAKQYAAWGREDFKWFERLENPNAPSWNYDFEVGASLLWLDPEFPEPGTAHSGMPSLTISSWWVDWLELQVGDIRSDVFAKDCPISRCFDGTETLSSVYAGKRYGAVLAVRLFALRNPSNSASADLLRLTTHYLRALSALLSLSSAPWTDPGYRAANGRQWYTGPTWAPVGERSEASGLQCCQGPLLALMRGDTFKLLRAEAPEYAAVSLYSQIAKEFPDSLAPSVSGYNKPQNALDALSGVRLWSEMHWTRWQGGLLVWSPRRLNPNTPKIFWAWLSDTDRRMTIGYPFPQGKHRGKGASGAQGNCQLSRNSGGSWTIRADGIDGGNAAVLDLPVTGGPQWSIIGDRDGFREEKL